MLLVVPRDGNQIIFELVYICANQKYMIDTTPASAGKVGPAIEQRQTLAPTEAPLIRDVQFGVHHDINPSGRLKCGVYFDSECLLKFLLTSTSDTMNNETRRTPKEWIRNFDS